MSHLAARLRSCGSTNGRAGDFRWQLLLEAADEIERLEAALTAARKDRQQ